MTAPKRQQSSKGKASESSQRDVTDRPEDSFSLSIAPVNNNQNLLSEFGMNKAIKDMMIGHCSVDLSRVKKDGWVFGKWNQRGIDRSHVTRMVERLKQKRIVDEDSGIAIALRRSWFTTTLEPTLNGKLVQDLPLLELTPEGKQAQGHGEFKPFGGNHRRAAVEFIVQDVKRRLEMAMDRLDLGMDGPDTKTTRTKEQEADYTAWVEKETQLIGYLKGESKWNMLWHLNIWDLDALESVQGYSHEDISIHLSRNSNKYVYLETDSERVFLDLRGVREALASDDKAWVQMTQKLASGRDLKITLAQPQENFKRALEKHLEGTIGMYNSTQNSMLSSPYAVRMMSRYVAFGDHYFNGQYATIRGLRGLIDQHMCGIISTIFEVNCRIIQLAGSKEPVGTQEEIDELADDRRSKVWGTDSKGWWKMYKSAGRHAGDMGWVAEVMPVFESAFDSAFVADGVIVQEFMTSTRPYMDAFKGYMSEVMTKFREKAEEDGPESRYLTIGERLEWLLGNWPYNKGVPMPVITNRMMGWMEQRLKPIQGGIEECIENPTYRLTDDRGCAENVPYRLANDRVISVLGTWFDPLAIHMINFSHSKSKARDLSAAMFDCIARDSALHDVSDAIEQVAFFVLINAHKVMVDFTSALFDLQQEIGVRPAANVIKKIPIPMSTGRKGKSKDEKAAESFFSLLTPPVDAATIDSSWTKMKPTIGTSKAVHRVSPDIEKRMYAVTTVGMTKDYEYALMSLLVERYFVDSYRPRLLGTVGGAQVRQQVTDILSSYWEPEEESSITTFLFWDGLKGDPKASKEGPLMSMAERNRATIVKALQQGNKDFNQRIINMVEKGKQAHENFDMKSPLGSGIRRAIDKLIWELEVHQERQILALHPKGGQRRTLFESDIPTWTYKHVQSVGRHLSPPHRVTPARRFGKRSERSLSLEKGKGPGTRTPQAGRKPTSSDEEDTDSEEDDGEEPESEEGSDTDETTGVQGQRSRGHDDGERGRPKSTKATSKGSTPQGAERVGTGSKAKIHVPGTQSTAGPSSPHAPDVESRSSSLSEDGRPLASVIPETSVPKVAAAARTSTSREGAQTAAGGSGSGGTTTRTGLRSGGPPASMAKQTSTGSMKRGRSSTDAASSKRTKTNDHSAASAATPNYQRLTRPGF
ncbi:hypothetical protein BS47DRAFT_1391878 [Hydnum rufescens UP504]|uniref:Uncharacterized protein n=1 Tax=Hydnum rufescens UP504 TaxID=1448309 RepID=A0A9P6B0L2_9AGAM|nr:hypothetical protein BS47DRAFT_1391878 [Hydnum rufescens UP504]